MYLLAIIVSDNYCIHQRLLYIVFALNITIEIGYNLRELSCLNAILDKESAHLRAMSAYTVHDHFEQEPNCIITAGNQIVDIETEGEIVSHFVATGLDHSALTTHEANSLKSSVFEGAIL